MFSAVKLESPDSIVVARVKPAFSTKVLDSVLGRNFAVVPGGIYFMQARDDGSDEAYSIRFLNLANGRVELIARLPRNTVPVAQGLSVSPDGQSILYTQVDDISSDLMLIEGFE